MQDLLKQREKYHCKNCGVVLNCMCKEIKAPDGRIGCYTCMPEFIPVIVKPPLNHVSSETAPTNVKIFYTRNS